MRDRPPEIYSGYLHVHRGSDLLQVFLNFLPSPMNARCLSGSTGPFASPPVPFAGSTAVTGKGPLLPSDFWTASTAFARWNHSSDFLISLPSLHACPERLKKTAVRPIVIVNQHRMK